MAFYAQSADIARLAMEIEDAGWVYYRKLAEASADREVKKIFTYLSDQEVQHKIIFEKISKEVTSQQQNEYVIDVVSQLETGISDLTTFVFPEKIDPSSDINIPVAIKIAIHAEDESIGAYSEMKKVFIARFSDVLTRIIQEEEHHRRILLDYLKTLPQEK